VPVSTQLPAATIILTSSNSNTTVNVKNGDTIEIDLPTGHTWSAPTIDPQNLLSKQGPDGSPLPSAKFCVWRYATTSTGTVNLSFVGRPICKKGELCPMYIMAVPFTIIIK
jgi:hypothetical protein